MILPKLDCDPPISASHVAGNTGIVLHSVSIIDFEASLLSQKIDQVKNSGKEILSPLILGMNYLNPARVILKALGRQ
jgi:hypothetical protein